MFLRLDRFDIGLFLVLGGGILSLLYFVSNIGRGLLFSPFVGIGLSITVIFGVILVYSKHVNIGCILALGPSLLFPFWLFHLTLRLPWPDDVVALVLYQAFADSNLLFFSLIGVILIMTSRLKKE